MRWVALALVLAACGPREARVIGGGSCEEGCGTLERCDAATELCVCEIGATRQGGVCTRGGRPNPEDRSKAGVCAQWREGHRISTPAAFVAGQGDCAAGSLEAGAIADTVRRVDMFRWLAGLGTVTSEPSFDADAQACAVIAAHWDFSTPGNPHLPPPGARCFSPEGARGAQTSNLTWGEPHPADAVDGFMEDFGADNALSLGHRRWILNPPLARIGVGHYQGGTNFGVAGCLKVFDMSGSGPSPPWNALPPAGFAPVETTRWTWSFQGSIPGIAGANVAMEGEDGAPLAIEIRRLGLGYGEESVSWVPVGWTAEVGKRYTVRVGGLVGGEIAYEVEPVSCD